MTGSDLIYTVKNNDKHIFLRDVLKYELLLSHSLLIKLKAENKIMVNGQVTLTSYKLRPGDVVSVALDLYERSGIVPQLLPLDIVYEDLDYLVVNKPAGLSVHPSEGKSAGTLANAVTCYWEQQNIYNLFRPINRLDRDTSGLILIGRSQYAHQAMFRQQKQGGLTRSYEAIVEGVLAKDSGDIDFPIALKDPDLRERIVDPAGKSALTSFQVVKRYADFTHLILILGTGRTHQIRVHLSHIGHPICGDSLYGHRSSLIQRQALHAGKLSFIQPRTGKTVDLSAPLPADMQEMLEKLDRGKGVTP